MTLSGGAVRGPARPRIFDTALQRTAEKMRYDRGTNFRRRLSLWLWLWLWLSSAFIPVLISERSTLPGIKISKTVKDKMPPGEASGLADFLWDKSHGLCFLCESGMNQTTEDIEADHDLAVTEGGSTDRANLNLVHQECNRAKKSTPTVDVRPWLRLKRFAHDRGNVIKYGDVQEHFKFAPQESVLLWTKGGPQAEWHLPDGRVENTQVFVERDGRGAEYHYSFVDVPREAIFNDDECQPRTIKIPQAWAIYSDTQNNPLHEPPSCRLVLTSSNSVRLLMFDGQHKSVAMWMHDKKRAVIKVYLNLDKDQTIRLVGSIQSRIRKLPLSSFENAMKMGEEWSARALAYENSVGTDMASEAGLIAWLDNQDRKRAKDAAKAQLLKDILELEDLKLLQFVQLAGREKDVQHAITETAFKTKVIAQLRHMAPLDEKGEEWQKARAREVDNIKFALNVLAESAFLNADGGTQLTGAAVTRRERMTYQASLAYVATLIRKLYRQVLGVDEESRAMLEKEPSEEQQARIRAGILRITGHPIWTCDFDKSPKTRAVKEALSKNQDAAAAFRAVELRGDYVSGAEPLDKEWATS